MELNKLTFLVAVQAFVQDKINTVQQELDQLRAEMASDTKSTAGDKHETARAMAQLEMEKLGKQSLEYQKQLQVIAQFSVNGHLNSTNIQAGSLVQLSSGYFFLGIPLGKIDINGIPVFCLSLQSPLGQQLLNKKMGEEITLPNLKSSVISIR